MHIPMASSALKIALFSAVIAAAMAAGFHQFEVGGKAGWRKPTGKEAETYNQWAAMNRFHIGDSLHFKYENDSVLVVSAADYSNCSTSNPISKFEDGSTVFDLDRSGFFYFISGNLRHCRSNQKLIVRVMHPLEEAESPELAPSPSAAGEDGWAPPSVNSSAKIALISCYLAAFAALFTIFYFVVV